MWESEPLKGDLTGVMSKYILCFIMWGFLFRWMESESSRSIGKSAMHFSFPGKAPAIGHTGCVFEYISRCILQVVSLASYLKHCHMQRGSAV